MAGMTKEQALIVMASPQSYSKEQVKLAIAVLANFGLKSI